MKCTFLLFVSINELPLSSYINAAIKCRNELIIISEDTIEDLTHQSTQPTTVPTDDVNIHVHKESSTGGGLCAKFVFFILLAVLAVLIGLIITEHRGLTDCKYQKNEFY